MSTNQRLFNKFRFIKTLAIELVGDQISKGHNYN